MTAAVVEMQHGHFFAHAAEKQDTPTFLHASEFGDCVCVPHEVLQHGARLPKGVVAHKAGEPIGVVKWSALQGFSAVAWQWQSEFIQDQAWDDSTLPSDKIGRMERLMEWLIRQVLPTCGFDLGASRRVRLHLQVHFV